MKTDFDRGEQFIQYFCIQCLIQSNFPLLPYCRHSHTRWFSWFRRSPLFSVGIAALRWPIKIRMWQVSSQLPASAKTLTQEIFNGLDDCSKDNIQLYECFQFTISMVRVWPNLVTYSCFVRESSLAHLHGIRNLSLPAGSRCETWFPLLKSYTLYPQPITLTSSLRLFVPV